MIGSLGHHFRLTRLFLHEIKTRYWIRPCGSRWTIRPSASSKKRSDTLVGRKTGSGWRSTSAPLSTCLGNIRMRCATRSSTKFLYDQHHRLLFKILDTSKDPNIRSNIVIALCDVKVSFSNIICENSIDLYKGLRWDLVARKQMLIVLTHLILNEMMYSWEILCVLEDPEPRIADLANNLVSLAHMCIMKLTHVLQSSATCQSANILMTRRCSRAQDISPRSLKRFAPVHLLVINSL